MAVTRLFCLEVAVRMTVPGWREVTRPVSETAATAFALLFQVTPALVPAGEGVAVNLAPPHPPYWTISR